ncbi:hypothetical protein [Sneathiella glossodoripedis]|uniref:hypothetical protein n=1 Tax=Sneathiella glossodoripedis TaxID=418853 RepID=UPI00046F6A88|nr:hypothetical protein [Sneathiella glossodoripedis]
MLEVNDVKEFVKALVEACPELTPVPSKSGLIDLVHLSVYETSRGSPIGVEYDHANFLNIWVRQADVDIEQLRLKEYVCKIWQPETKTDNNDSPWRSSEDVSGQRNGANSNLESPVRPVFQKHDLYRFKVDKCSQVLRLFGEVLGA